MHKNPTPPAGVTIPAILVLFITSWFGIRAYGSIANWQVLIEFGANPAYILGTGLFWAASGLWLFSSIWRGKRIAARAGSFTAVLYILWYWFDRLVMQPAPAPNTIFSMVISTIGLAFFIIILNHPASRSFFNKE